MTQRRFLVPIRYSAWLSGETGTLVQSSLQDTLTKATVTRLPRGLLVETSQEAGVALEEVIVAAKNMDSVVANEKPVCYQEMGPVWTGTIQYVHPVGPE